MLASCWRSFMRTAVTRSSRWSSQLNSKYLRGCLSWHRSQYISNVTRVRLDSRHLMIIA
jgi:hypothetical protein